MNAVILFEFISACNTFLFVILIGPRQANLVLIAYASSEGSGEPAHLRSLARTSLLAHKSSESRGTFRQKARSLAPLNGWACAVKICHDGMLEDTNSLGAAQLMNIFHHANCSKIDKKAMIRNRYNQIPHPALNTKRERDTYN